MPINGSSDYVCCFYLQFCCLLGEPFTKDEIEEMLHASIERGQDVLLYKDYVTLMVPEEDN